MKKFVLLLISVFFLNATCLDESKIYKNTQKILNINHSFLTLIEAISHNSKLRRKLDLLSMDINNLLKMLKLYKQPQVQSYFKYLQNQNYKLGLILIPHKNKINFRHMPLITNINQEIIQIKRHKVNSMKNIKKLYKLVLDILDIEVYMIDRYDLYPDFVIAKKDKEKLTIIKALSQFREYIKKDYQKNIKPY